MPKRNNMSKPNPVSKIDQLAQLAGNELTGDFQRDEEIRRAESQPAAQAPMITSTEAAPAEQNYSQIVQGTDSGNRLSDEVTAALLFAGMTATWAHGFWMVRFRDGRTVTKRVGGQVLQRSQTGVGRNATLSEWMTEINSLAGMNVFGNPADR